MKREIKFRAWDKEEKIMLPVVDLSAPRHTYMWLGVVDGLEIMQYTGLKDKNGKEIYEGDIVRNAGIENARPYEVEWHTECEDGGDYPSYSTGFYLIDRGYDIEIIGNIYSNPDLLT